MNKQKSKKLNSHQKTIAVIALIVTVLLAICITFAWYTNRINTMGALFELGEFDYNITLFDVSGTTASETHSEHYSHEDEDDWELSTQDLGVGTGSVKYQVIKVKNNSTFGIKAYEYLTYENNVTPEQEALADYFYFRPFKLDFVYDSGSLTSEQAQLSAYLASYNLPDADDISSSQGGGVTFGTIKNNAIALEADAVEGSQTQYYLIGYCVNGLPDAAYHVYDDVEVLVHPMLTIGQANGPIPQSSGSSRVIYADSWQSLRSAIAGANSGDTIYLTGSIDAPAHTNLSISNGVNLNLNTYNLTIHGDLVFNYKDQEERKLTVPQSSTLTVDGNMYIETTGPFSVNSTGASDNIKLGYYDEDAEAATGGHLYVNCGLSVKEGTLTTQTDDLDDVFTVDERSGLTLNNIKIQKMDNSGEYVNADLEVVGTRHVTHTETMIRLISNAQLNSITVVSGQDVHGVYVANYGTIESVSLANVNYNVGTLRIGAYIKNYKTVNSLELSNNAKGFKTTGLAVNTRVINGDGASTAFSGNYAPDFQSRDIEPFNGGGESSYVTYNQSNNTYTVYLRNISENSGASAEMLTALFTAAGYNYENCEKLKVVTNNGIKLKETQFDDIRNNFITLQRIDLSSAAIEDSMIPAGALDATAAGSVMQKLKQVELPVTDIGIGAYAFRGTKITEITISSNVSSIGTGAFDIADTDADDNYAPLTLEVTWDNSIDIPNNYLAGFDVNQTIIFMDESLAQRALTNPSYTDEWKLNMYELYEFKASGNEYYCKYSRDGSTATGCEIIYFAGSVADKQGGELVPAELNDGSRNYTVVAIKRQAFRKAISLTASGAPNGVNITLTDCISVGDSAFEATSEARLKVIALRLGKVNDIGSRAFSNNTILNSIARPSTFTGMVHLGANAFENAGISGGILDLHGPEEKYEVEDYALSGLSFNGTYLTGNAVLDLRNARSLPEHFANGATLKADIWLSDVESIAGNAFKGAIEPNDENNPTNVVDARNVISIGANAFYDIQCGTLYLGAEDDAYIRDENYYISIIGRTTGTNIGTLVLDGEFATLSGTPALASASSSEVVTINKLKIARVVDENDEVVTTTIPEYAFATKATKPNDGNNLIIKAVETGDTVGGETVYASFNIGAAAFAGTGFESAVEYKFEGVINVYDEAFARSTIVNLNLGNAIRQISSENFISYCDNIRDLTIERIIAEDVQIGTDDETGEPIYRRDVDFHNSIVKLVGVSNADPKFSSTGAKVDGFTIHVHHDLITTYIAAQFEEALNVWHGWKDYFEAKTYSVAAAGGYFEYYVIQPDDVSKGVHIYNYVFNGADVPESAKALTITVPTVINVGGTDFNVTEFGEETDMFSTIPARFTPTPAVNGRVTTGVTLDFGQCDYLNYISGAALQSDKLIRLAMDPSYVANTTCYYKFDLAQGTLFKQNIRRTSDANAENEIVKVFDYISYTNSGGNVLTAVRGGSYIKQMENPTTYYVAGNVKAIRTGAFAGTKVITGVYATKYCTFAIDTGRNWSQSNPTTSPKLETIGADAFTGSNVGTFDFREVYNRTDATLSKVITAGKDAFGPAREKILNDAGYYQYQKKEGISIIVPKNVMVYPTLNTTLETMYRISEDYFLYSKYGDISSATSLLGEVDEEEDTTDKSASLKPTQFDITLGGIRYHLMSDTNEYNGVTYESKKTKMVAVVTGLNEQTAASATVVIPSTVTYRGVNYEVVGITDTAFGTNAAMETLVLPHRDLIYTSVAIASCSKLGTIQFNDLNAYVENAQNTVASLPTQSAQSLIESSLEEDRDE